ncbi:MAG: nucleoside deaminase [Pseudomonadota bacterium]|jgi:tRNA(adenine34) deaminase|nr:nucleoside deaminase [Pseudomonadota bacterium]|tara:strand:+ start:998 stop:1453 length:456 start_codon:yes stop_codon:yes gene_type:complete
MRRCLDLASISYENEEVPIGAVLTLKNKIISESHNSVISDLDPTSHAEIKVIRDAAKKLGNYRLNDTTLYTSLEPCIMCLGAITEARIKEVYYAAESDENFSLEEKIATIKKVFPLDHIPKVKKGFYKDESSRLLKEFFIERRNNTSVFKS